MFADTLHDKINVPMKKLLKDLVQAFEEGDYSQALMKNSNIHVLLQGSLMITQLVKEDI